MAKPNNINLSKIKLGMTRDEVKAILGEPDDEGGGSNKYPTPIIYVYGERLNGGLDGNFYELTFEPYKNGELVMVMKMPEHVIADTAVRLKFWDGYAFFD